MLYIICGLPGTGKSFVAKIVQRETDAILLQTDKIRKELVQKPDYSEDEKRKTYGEMFLQARALLNENKDVILDAVFYAKDLRTSAKSLSEDYIILETVCSEENVKKRLSKDRKLSDADFLIYQKMKESFEPLEESQTVINTDKPKREIRTQIQRVLA